MEHLDGMHGAHPGHVLEVAEQRPGHEVTEMAAPQMPGTAAGAVGGLPVAPLGAQAYNPAFDVTPARYIRGIITEVGVAMPPNDETIAALFAGR